MARLLTLPICLALLTYSAQAADLDLAYLHYRRGDLAAAAADYRQAAKRGNALAQFNYAMMLKRGEASGEDWLPWLEQAARGGVMNAAFALGLAYEHGDGVAKSLTEATHWFRAAAEQGHVAAQVDLATQYYLGRGAPHDGAQAAFWYEKAADAGDVGAQYLIASMYEHGEGVKMDRARAIDWYVAAARQGDAAARLKADALARQ
jgi:TPR repeat protein